MVGQTSRRLVSFGEHMLGDMLGVQYFDQVRTAATLQRKILDVFEGVGTLALTMTAFAGSGVVMAGGAAAAAGEGAVAEGVELAPIATTQDLERVRLPVPILERFPIDANPPIPRVSDERVTELRSMMTEIRRVIPHDFHVPTCLDGPPFGGSGSQVTTTEPLLDVFDRIQLTIRHDQVPFTASYNLGENRLSIASELLLNPRLKNMTAGAILHEMSHFLCHQMGDPLLEQQFLAHDEIPEVRVPMWARSSGHTPRFYSTHNVLVTKILTRASPDRRETFLGFLNQMNDINLRPKGRLLETYDTDKMRDILDTDHLRQIFQQRHTTADWTEMLQRFPPHEPPPRVALPTDDIQSDAALDFWEKYEAPPFGGFPPPPAP